MHFYPFHIADYHSHTGHLSEMEDLAYRRLIDWQHLHERPIPADIQKASRLVRLPSFSTDVEQVLNEFFTLAENGYINQRCFDDIDKYNNIKTAASRAGKASAEKRKATRKQRVSKPDSTDVQRPFNECATNQEPITINHKEHKDCSERSNERASLAVIPLKSGEHEIFESDIEEAVVAFSNLNKDQIISELKKCALWNKSNPSKRKTKRGIMRHVASWLSRANDSAAKGTGKPRRQFQGGQYSEKAGF